MGVVDDGSNEHPMRVGITEAAAELLRECGSDAVTTRRVAAAAGVQAPAIYRLFGDKEGLLDAVAEYVLARYIAAKEGAFTSEWSGDPLEALRSGWRAHIEFGLTNPEIFLRLNSRRSELAVNRQGRQVLQRSVHRLASAEMLRIDENAAVSMIEAAAAGTVLIILRGGPHSPDLTIADLMLETVLGAILTEKPYMSGDSVTPKVVTFATLVPDLPGLSSAEKQLMAEWVGRVIGQLSCGDADAGASPSAAT